MSGQELSDMSMDELVALALENDRGSDVYQRALRELHSRDDDSRNEMSNRLMIHGPRDNGLILGIQLRDQLDRELRSRTTDELVALALRLDRDSRFRWYWRVVGKLRGRGDQELFERASRFAVDGPGERERILGIDILDHLGGEQGAPGPFVDQSVPLVEALAGPGQSAPVLRAAIEALTVFCDNRPTRISTPVVLAHVHHSDPGVRRAVARALAPPGICNNPPPAAVLDAVFALAEDTDEDVRDWATFALAHFDVDTPEIRDALAARLGDSHDVALNAVSGLVSRHDARALEPIIGWLDMRDRLPVGFILKVLYVAAELADSRCLPALYALRDEWDESPPAHRDAWNESRPTSALAAAIRACERGRAPTT